jgi:hypothetical protein
VEAAVLRFSGLDFACLQIIESDCVDPRSVVSLRGKSFYQQAKSGDGSIGIHFQVDGSQEFRRKKVQRCG